MNVTTETAPAKTRRRAKVDLTAAREALEFGDMGPAVRVDRGDVVQEQRADPRYPARTVKGGRVHPLHERLLREGLINRAMAEAATDYLRRIELVEVGRTPEGGGGSRAPWDREPLSEATAHALGRLRAAYKRLGALQRRVLHLVVVRELPLAEVFHEALPGWHRTKRGGGRERLNAGDARNRALGLLIGALDVLVDEWRVVPNPGKGKVR